MNRLVGRSAATVAIAALASSPVAAQIYQASGYATVNMAGLGNTTTVAGESRIPILLRDLSYDPATTVLHVRATGHRGAVRQLDLNVRGAHASTRFDVTADGAVSLHVHLDTGPELVAEPGHGFIQIATMDAQHVTGTYEGTFNGAVPVVIRGRFDASFPRSRDGGTSSASP